MTLGESIFDEEAVAIRKLNVDFKQTYAPSLSGRYLVVLDDVFSSHQCKKLIAAAESQTDVGWSEVVELDDNGTQRTRQCTRIMWDSPQLVAKLWARIENLVPELRHRRDMTETGWEKDFKMTRLNERMRFLRYEEGEYFQVHPDCYYETEDGRERSYITLLLFLNDQASGAEENGLRGGAISFYSQDLKEHFDIVPKAGRILLFEQENLLHSGQRVDNGIKYAMRTDLMYEM